MAKDFMENMVTVSKQVAYLGREMKALKKKQMKILELKTRITNLETHQMDLIADWRQRKGELTWRQINRNDPIWKTDQSYFKNGQGECPVRHYQTSTINVIAIPKGQDNKWGRKIFEETMTKFFPNLVKNYKYTLKKLNKSWAGWIQRKPS